MHKYQNTPDEYVCVVEKTPRPGEPFGFYFAYFDAAFLLSFRFSSSDADAPH